MFLCKHWKQWTKYTLLLTNNWQHKVRYVIYKRWCFNSRTFCGNKLKWPRSHSRTRTLSILAKNWRLWEFPEPSVFCQTAEKIMGTRMIQEPCRVRVLHRMQLRFSLLQEFYLGDGKVEIQVLGSRMMTKANKRASEKGDWYRRR